MQKGETPFDHVAPIARTKAEASALVAPADVFSEPRDVVAHPTLSHEEKRAILAAWASDAQTVASYPTLRCLPGSTAVVAPVSAVLAALDALDTGTKTGRGEPSTVRLQAQRRPRPFWNVRRAYRPRRDDDDDPPPCPAAAMPRPRPPAPRTEAVAVFA